MPIYKALTVYQPWADLIAHGLKHYETRAWKTEHRGVLFIHAGRQWDSEEIQYAQRFRREYPQVAVVCDGAVPLGCIVAAVRLIDCIPVEQIRDTLSPMERAFGNYEDGRYAWQVQVLKRPLEPIPATGKQGIWNWEYVPERVSA
jgi:hypothetical protein